MLLIRDCGWFICQCLKWSTFREFCLVEFWPFLLVSFGLLFGKYCVTNEYIHYHISKDFRNDLYQWFMVKSRPLADRAFIINEFYLWWPTFSRLPDMKSFFPVLTSTWIICDGYHWSTDPFKHHSDSNEFCSDLGACTLGVVNK